MLIAENKEYRINIENLIKYLDGGNTFEYSYTYKDVKGVKCMQYISIRKNGNKIITEVGEKPSRDDIYVIDLENSAVVPGIQRLLNVTNYDLARGENFRFSEIGNIVEAI